MSYKKAQQAKHLYRLKLKDRINSRAEMALA